jgi:hypothetical protein
MIAKEVNSATLIIGIFMLLTLKWLYHTDIIQILSEFTTKQPEAKVLFKAFVDTPIPALVFHAGPSQAF